MLGNYHAKLLKKNAKGPKQVIIKEAVKYLLQNLGQNGISVSVSLHFHLVIIILNLS